MLRYAQGVKYVEIRAFLGPYFTAYKQTRTNFPIYFRFCPYMGKYGCDSVYIRENTYQRKPGFWRISYSDIDLTWIEKTIALLMIWVQKNKTDYLINSFFLLSKTKFSLPNSFFFPFLSRQCFIIVLHIFNYSMLYLKFV